MFHIFSVKGGYPVISVDISEDPRFDLTNRDVINLIIGWIRSKCILGVWLATVCTSWSRARHGPVGSSWGPVRDDAHICSHSWLAQFESH